MLMHHAKRVLLATVAWLIVAPRCQWTTNGAIGLKPTPPTACKEDACKCAPQAYLILDADQCAIEKVGLFECALTALLLPYANNRTI